MALALPKLRWLLIGAIAAGVWVVREDMKTPRPPERVQPQATRQATGGKPAPDAPRPPETIATRSALSLPATVERPPVKPQKIRPQKITTGSVGRPAASAEPATRQRKPTYVQTTAKVRLRAQARTDADVIATLEPRTVMRELARSGKWRLLMGEGRKGWVHADYLDSATYLARRPKLPVAEVSQAGSAKKP